MKNKDIKHIIGSAVGHLTESSSKKQIIDAISPMPKRNQLLDQTIKNQDISKNNLKN